MIYSYTQTKHGPVMLGMDSFAGGAMAGVSLGVGLGLLNVITDQIFGVGWIDWAAGRAMGA